MAVRRRLREFGPFCVFSLVIWAGLIGSAGEAAAAGNRVPNLAAVAEATALQPLTVGAPGAAPHRFEVELAATDDARTKGLMFRTELADDGGMLFDYGRDTDVAMWMKNTYIPLDMLFIDARGVVVYIRENTTPQSLQAITAGVPVRAVLELKGGTAKRLGLAVGDRVQHAIFGSDAETGR